MDFTPFDDDDDDELLNPFTYKFSKIPAPLPPDEYVIMANALTRAGHGLNLAEKRLIIAAIIKLQKTNPRKKETPDSPNKITITAEEYSEISDVTLSAAYRALKSAAKQLYSRSINFYTPSYRRNGKKIGETFTQMRWVTAANYHEHEGSIDLFFNPDVRPFFAGLKKQFTTYKLQQATAFRSVYSWRLLELITRFQATGWAEYSIEDFCASLDIPPKIAANFGKVRTKAIEPAVKELCEKDGWLINWEPIKGGRRVKGVRFEFKRDPQGRLF